MESLRELYKVGNGPSSSHTMGPKKATETFLEKCPNASSYEVTLYGSLAATGKGHLTGEIIEKTLVDKCYQIHWLPKTFLPTHPNALKFEAFDSDGMLIESWTAYSVGGGKIIDATSEISEHRVYDLTTMEEIINYCNTNGKEIWQYVEECEGPEIWDYLRYIWKTMKNSIKLGLEAAGTLPGGLKLPRKAQTYLAKAKQFSGPIKKQALLYSYALAVSEQNACGGVIVTSPTCGASGVLPAVLQYFRKVYKYDEATILRALATAGLVGNIVKYNASISGAEVGCQGEVGVACAMASAAATQISGGSVYQIEYSAEMGLEHHLGLTCDPIAGLVQIPCIERNAFAAARALDHNTYSILSDGSHRVSFDEVIQVMKETGDDLSTFYKETSEGGLAKFKGLPRVLSIYPNIEDE